MKTLRKTMLLAAVTALAMWPVANLRAQGVEDFEDEFEEPEYEAPEVDEPEFEEPEIEEPEVEEPEVDEPEVEEPEVEEPEVEEPEVEEPEVEEPEVETPEAGESEAEQDDSYEDQGSESEDSAEDGGEASSDEDGTATDAMSGDDWIADIAQARDVEFDDNGFPVERGEIFALDLGATAREALLREGFAITATTELEGLGAHLTTLAVPAGRSVGTALAMARATDPEGIYDFGHFYGSPYDAAGRDDGRRGSPAPATARGSGTLRLGLIDTQVRADAMPRNVNVTSRAFGASDAAGRSDHGTAVASILVGHGAGELVVANVFAGAGRGSFTSASEIGRALSWMLESRVGVVNVSLTGPRNAVLDTLVRRATQRGMVVVAAAGNGGPASAPAYPAALPEVVAVTAVDSARRIYRYANRGDYIRLATYGVRVPVPGADGATQYFTGTSFAAPRVATRIADCISRGTSSSDCIARLERSAIDLGQPGRDEVYGYGFVE